VKAAFVVLRKAVPFLLYLAQRTRRYRLMRKRQ